jgi:biotin synthase
MADTPPLDINDILRTIALFRLILLDIPLRLAAGRESVLTDFLSSAFMAGADAMMIGGYLTKRGRSVAKDLQFVKDMKKIWQR